MFGTKFRMTLVIYYFQCILSVNQINVEWINYCLVFENRWLNSLICVDSLNFFWLLGNPRLSLYFFTFVPAGVPRHWEGANFSQTLLASLWLRSLHASSYRLSNLGLTVTEFIVHRQAKENMILTHTSRCLTFVFCINKRIISHVLYPR